MSTIHALNNRHWLVSFLAFLTCFKHPVFCLLSPVLTRMSRTETGFNKYDKGIWIHFHPEIVSVCMTRADRKWRACWMFLEFAFIWFTLAVLNEAGTDFEYLFALAGKRPPINLNSTNPQDSWKSCPKTITSFSLWTDSDADASILKYACK